MVIDQLKLLLGPNNTLTDDTIKAIIYMAQEHYLRFRPYTDKEKWGENSRARSWITEYALAYCKLTLGEGTHPSPREILVKGALEMIQLLEAELQKYT